MQNSGLWFNECLFFSPRGIPPAAGPGGTANAFWKVSVVGTAAETSRAGMVVDVADGRLPLARNRCPTAERRGRGRGGQVLHPGPLPRAPDEAGARPAWRWFIANSVTPVRDMGSDLREVLHGEAMVTRTRVSPRIKTPVRF